MAKKKVIESTMTQVVPTQEQSTTLNIAQAIEVRNLAVNQARLSLDLGTPSKKLLERSSDILAFLMNGTVPLK